MLTVDLHLHLTQPAAGDLQAEQHLTSGLFALCAPAFLCAIPQPSARGDRQRGGGRPPKPCAAADAFGDGPLRCALKHSFSEPWRRVDLSKCPPESVVQLVVPLGCHDRGSPTTRIIFSRSILSARCSWLFTLATGVSRTRAISSGIRSSW